MGRGWGPVTLITQVGLTIAAGIVIGLLLGLWIDSHFGTSPWFTLVFTLVGLVGGSVSVYQMLVAAIDQAANEGKPDARRHDSHEGRKGDEP